MSGALSNPGANLSATPADAEIEAWRDLPRDVQVRRLRELLASPDALNPNDATMADIWDEIEADR